MFVRQSIDAFEGEPGLSLDLFSDGLEDDLVLGGALPVADAFAVYRWSPERRLWLPVRVQVMLVDASNHRGWDPGRDFWRSLRLSDEAPVTRITAS